jgi:hypothetical protein
MAQAGRSRKKTSSRSKTSRATGRRGATRGKK